MDFTTQFAAQAKAVFSTLAQDALAHGADPDEEAQRYAERGKPDFALAYLLLGSGADADKRAVLAHAYERRAILTEQQARDFDRRFHRPFPLLFTEANKDRATARRLRADEQALPDPPADTMEQERH